MNPHPHLRSKLEAATAAQENNSSDCRDCEQDPTGLDSALEFGLASPHSPTLSDRSMIFERNVQEDDPFLLAPSGSTTLTSLTVNELSKQRSNSSASLYRQRTSDSVSSTGSYIINNNTANIPPPVSIIPNRRLSRANSSSNTMNPLISPLSTSMTSSSGYLSPTLLSNNYNMTSGPIPNSNNGSSTPCGTNGLHHHRRRTLENYVAPALDASCSLMADQGTDLKDVNIIHSRSSSIIGLNMALGRVRSYSQSMSNTRHNSSADLSTVQNDNNGNDDINEENNNSNNNNNLSDPKVLKFYSYNDLLTDEKINISQSSNLKRPSLTSSYSTSYFKAPTSPLQQTQQGQQSTNPHFLNPFVIRRGSSPFLPTSQQQNPRRYSNNNGMVNPLSKSPTNSSMQRGDDMLANNLNNTSSVLLQDPLSTGNVTPTNIKNHLRRSISKGINQQRKSQENVLMQNMSKFHIASSESDSESDNDNAVAEDDYDEDNSQIISSVPVNFQKLRSLSNSSNRNSSPLMIKTTNFLNSTSRNNSIIKLQQHYENVVTETIPLAEPLPLEEYQLQQEKIGDVIRDKVTSLK